MFREEPLARPCVCLAEPSLSPPLTTSVGFPRTPPVASHAERGSPFGRNDMKGETFPCEQFWLVLPWQLSSLHQPLRTTTSFRNRLRSDAGSLRNARHPVSG